MHALVCWVVQFPRACVTYPRANDTAAPSRQTAKFCSNVGDAVFTIVTSEQSCSDECARDPKCNVAVYLSTTHYCMKYPSCRMAPADNPEFVLLSVDAQSPIQPTVPSPPVASPGVTPPVPAVATPQSEPAVPSPPQPVPVVPSPPPPTTEPAVPTTTSPEQQPTTPVPPPVAQQATAPRAAVSTTSSGRRLLASWREL